MQFTAALGCVIFFLNSVLQIINTYCISPRSNLWLAHNCLTTFAFLKLYSHCLWTAGENVVLRVRVLWQCVLEQGSLSLPIMPHQALVINNIVHSAPQTVWQLCRSACQMCLLRLVPCVPASKLVKVTRNECWELRWYFKLELLLWHKTFFSHSVCK